MKNLFSTPSPRRSDNCFGIELECSIPSHVNVESLIRRNKLAKWVSIGRDSVPEPGNTAYELKLLVSEKEVSKIVKKLISALKEVNAVVNKSCGTHVHIDTRHRDQAKVFNNLRLAQPLLYKLVHPTRAKNKYCKPQKDDYRKNKEEVLYFKNRFWWEDTWHFDRYKGVVLSDKYNTVEVRIKEGCLKAEDIINWCFMLSSIADMNPLKNKVVNIDNLNVPLPLKLYALEKIKENKARKGQAIGLSYAA